MADIPFGSAGVSATEIDATGTPATQPSGVPAGIIGTATEGPAFVPVLKGAYSEWKTLFGENDGTMFGPIAVNEWLKNANSVAYLRVLGVGDGKKRSTSTGEVTNAGFTVGERLVQANGSIGKNKYGYDVSDFAAPVVTANTVKGRTHFLGCFMSQSDGANVAGDTDKGIFTDSDISILGEDKAHPILRAVLLTPSGVRLTLSTSIGPLNASNDPETLRGQANLKAVYASSNAAGAIDVNQTFVGYNTGTLNTDTHEFVLLINGLKPKSNESGDNLSVITASFNPVKPSYLGNVLNKEVDKFEELGHLLYTEYPVFETYAVVTASGLVCGEAQPSGGESDLEQAAFITTGSAPRNEYGAQGPNFEGFKDRFRAPFSPYVTSQKFGGTTYDLFRVHSISDGDVSNTRFKISISNITLGAGGSPTTFAIEVRPWTSQDGDGQLLEPAWIVDLDPTSRNFVARVIGDQKMFYDFDKAPSQQRMVIEGDYPNKSNYIRIEQSPALINGQVPSNAVPVGFRGPYHLNTSGSLPLAQCITASVASYVADAGGGVPHIVSNDTLKRVVEPPVPFRQSISVGQGMDKTDNSDLYWGVQFEESQSKLDPNIPAVIIGADGSQKIRYSGHVRSLTRLFPIHHPTSMNPWAGANAGTPPSGGTVLDSDVFNNNAFSLEKIKVVTGSDGLADSEQWLSCSYVRKGNISVSDSAKTRAWKIDDLKVSGNRLRSKFSFFLQGGFDGVNMFDPNKRELTNTAVKREIDDSTNQGGLSGPTVATYRKAVEVMGDKSNVDFKLLAIPGIRHNTVTDFAMDAIENRFDSLYIMDIEERDAFDAVITSSLSSPNVTYTVQAFRNRNLDSSFTAAYFPDIQLLDPDTGNAPYCPASVGALSAFSLNDRIGQPWFAPAGQNRGKISGAQLLRLSLGNEQKDSLYDAKINPIVPADTASGDPMVFGQKTLQQAASSLDRVNVRRLLIELRRQVRAVANSLLFEPNREETLARFSALVNPILKSIQENSGVDRYKVVIDTTTTTQADVENNTIRGKIFLQPTRTAEFISLDFVLSNAGSDAFDNV